MKKVIKLKKINEETQVLRNQLARALADYDNLKKRVERDRQDFEKIANLRLVIRLLPILDILKQAQNHVKDQGIAITIKEFEDTLKAEGIEEIEIQKGDKFDPDVHEAVEAVSGWSDSEEPTVSEVVLAGWKFTSGPVIRHAKVKVTN